MGIDKAPSILSKFTILQMMHVSGHKTEKTFRDYIKLSSDEIADELKIDEFPLKSTRTSQIDAIVNGTKNEVF